MALGKQDFLEQASKAMKNKPTKHEAMLGERLDLIWPKLFQRQWIIGDCIIDFYSPLLNLAIEVDGKSHGSKKGRANDLIKNDILKSRDAFVFRFSNLEVFHSLDAVVQEIQAKVESIIPSNTKRQKWAWTAAGLPKEIRRKARGASPRPKPYGDLG